MVHVSVDSYRCTLAVLLRPGVLQRQTYCKDRAGIRCLFARQEFVQEIRCLFLLLQNQRIESGCLVRTESCLENASTIFFLFFLFYIYVIIRSFLLKSI